eukprot:529274_1
MDFIKKLTSKKKSKKAAHATPEPTPSQPKLHTPNPNAAPPKSILKNKGDAGKFNNTDAYPTSDDIDESLRNAQKNSSLNQSLYGTPAMSPQNEEAKQGDANTKEAKDLKWDEQNLEQNEREKVPRMKIDEPPTPYAELPPELRDDFDDVEEVILDANPMDDTTDMSMEDNDEDMESTDNAQHKSLDQKQQALLLADEEYRQKMVNDAMARRQPNETNTKKKIVSSAWEEDGDGNSTPQMNIDTQESPDEVAKKEKFKKRRKAHHK